MENLEQLMAQRLSTKRLQHSLGVAETAAKLASAYGADPQKARLAGLVHDYARELPNSELITLARQLNILDPITEAYPELLHAPLGAHLVHTELGISDQNILQAIDSHTLGRRNMSTLEQIIYLADMIEPGRDYEGVEVLRQKAQLDLQDAIISALNHTVRYLLDTGKAVHERTIAARNSLIMGGE